METVNRREFLSEAGAAVGLSLVAGEAQAGTDPSEETFLQTWQAETDQVRSEDYKAYFASGQNPKGLASLDRLEKAFDKVLGEIDATRVGEVPAVWLVYNMGVVVKTAQSLFAIDLVHRRGKALAPKLDFLLVTHNHSDHFLSPLYREMDRSGKTVISNFLDNYGAADWRKGGGNWWAGGGYTRTEKTFRIKDVEIRTMLTDHNPYLIDFTTAFEIRVGAWRMFHSGDCSNVGKLKAAWGQPDLWVQMPGCGIDNIAGERKLHPALTAFGHMWELAHATGRVTADFVRPRLAKVRAAGGRVVIPAWGERIV